MTSTTSTIRLASTFSQTPVFENDDVAVSLPPEPLPIDVDVLVVGASFAGLGASIELAVRKHDVLVLEEGDVGSDPFVSGLGRLQPTLPAGTVLPNDAADALVAAAGEADRWTKRVIREFSIPCDFDPDAEPADLNPAALYRGIVVVARTHGVKVKANTRVVSVTPAADGGFDVKTSAGRLKARHVVLADPSTVKTLVPHGPVQVVDRPWAYLVTEPVPVSVKIAADPGLRVLTDRRILASAEVGGSFSDARDELGARLFGSQPALQSASADGAELRIENAWQQTFACSSTGIAVVGQHDGIYFVLPGSPDDLARMAWAGSRVARWMTGEAEPAFGVQPAGPKLAALVGRIKAKANR